MSCSSRFSNFLIDRAAFKPGDQVIDVGCAAARPSIALAKEDGPNGHVLGIDVSGPMLARARQVVPQGLPVDFALTDGCLPFDPGKVLIFWFPASV